MKKAITILAILAIVVGAVFAETHKIQIKADVTQIVPVFGLRYGENAATFTNSTTRIADDEDPNFQQYTNRYGLAEAVEGVGEEGDPDYVAPVAEVPYTYGYTSNAIDVGFNLDKGGSVTVYACLLNPAKQIKTYLLTFGDGVFDVKRQGVTENQTLAPASITTAALANTAGCRATAGSAAASGETGNYVINVAFDGKTVAAATSDVLPLASAVYAYSADETIDMLAAGEFYYADIVLGIAAQ